MRFSYNFSIRHRSRNINVYSYILTLVGDKAVLRLHLPLPGTRYLVNIYHEMYEGIRLHASVVYSSF